MDSLPLHILPIILSRLSTKTLLQLRPVCRLLRDTIDDLSFHSVYLSDIAREEPFRILLLLLPQIQSLSPFQSLIRSVVPRLGRLSLAGTQVFLLPQFGLYLSEEPEKPDRYNHADDRFLVSFMGRQGISHSLYPYGSCCGLLCLESVYDRVIFLFNPTLRESVSLPKPNTCTCEWVWPRNAATLQMRVPLTREGRECGHMFGIGFHPLMHEYKMVHVGWYKKGLEAVPRAEVLNQGSRTWRKIESVPPYCFSLDPVYMDGFIHWVAEDRMVSFCIVEEEFVSAALPAGRDPELFKLVDLGSCKLGLVEVSDVFIYMWVLNEDRQWVKEYRIDLYYVRRVYERFAGFEVVGGCGNDGNIILKCENSYSIALFSYNLSKGTSWHEAWLPRMFNWYSEFGWYLLNFKISLISPVKLWNVENCPP